VTARDDIERLATLAQAGDDDARARLVEAALGRLRTWAGRYRGRGVSLDDLVQDAVVGLLRALERFDPERGVPFLGWAEIWVRQSLQQAIAEHGRPLRLPRHVLWDLHELKDRHEALMRSHGHEPRLMELADDIGWPAERVARTLRLGQDPGSPAALDLLDDPLGEAAYSDVLTRVTAGQVLPLLLHLSERERNVVAQRARGVSLRDIGRDLGISGERVRVIEERALTKLRVAALGDSLRDPRTTTA
jgi:DNA-directed RNA polymerase sigma subunit (sigma70/sigma32)